VTLAGREEWLLLLEKLVAGAVVASAVAAIIMLGRVVCLYCVHTYAHYLQAVQHISSGF
jgi:hypothetical protein